MKARQIVYAILLSIVLFLMYFYRKPEVLQLPPEPNVIRSPAYGQVMKIFTQPDDTLVVSIFLSPFDIHYQQAPCNGQVIGFEYDRTGKFELAYEETKSRMNEKTIISVAIPQGVMKIYQIAGFLVRRIDTYVKPGDSIQTSQLLGLIKFGSRVDLLLPQASQFQLFVTEGSPVKGTRSIIGKYK